MEISTEPAIDQFQRAAEEMREAVKRVHRETDERAAEVERLYGEILTLAQTPLGTVSGSQAGNYTNAIRARLDALANAVNAMTAIQPASRPWMACFPYLYGMATPFESRYREYQRQQQEEEARQQRAAAYAEAERFEEQLRERLRRGDNIDAEAERRRFNELQAAKRPTPVLSF